jgi:hypothetical protein
MQQHINLLQAAEAVKRGIAEGKRLAETAIPGESENATGGAETTPTPTPVSEPVPQSPVDVKSSEDYKVMLGELGRAHCCLTLTPAPSPFPRLERFRAKYLSQYHGVRSSRCGRIASLPYTLYTL